MDKFGGDFLDVLKWIRTSSESSDVDQNDTLESPGIFLFQTVPISSTPQNLLVFSVPNCS